MRNQKAIWTIVIIVIIAVVGGVSWYLVSQDDDTNSNTVVVNKADDGCPAPKIILSKGEGKNILNLCGDDTSYEATRFIDLEKENDPNKPEFSYSQYIGFVDDKDKFNVINTDTAPYEEVTIAEEINPSGECVTYKGLFTCENIGDGPGTSREIFTFNPTTKEYVYTYYNKFPEKPTIANFSSSYSDEAFSMNIEYQCPESDSLNCVYEDTIAMDISMKDVTYSKQDYSDNKDNIKNHIDCLDSFDYWSIDLASKISNSNYDLSDDIDSVSENFDSMKIECRVGTNSYFDFKKNEFISETDDWLTYTNEEYSIILPNDFSLIKTPLAGEGENIIRPKESSDSNYPSILIAFDVYPSESFNREETFEIRKDFLLDRSYRDRETIYQIIDGEEGWIQTGISDSKIVDGRVVDGKVNMKDILLIKNSTVFTISLRYEDDDKDIIGKFIRIIDSFKFVN